MTNTDNSSGTNTNTTQHIKDSTRAASQDIKTGVHDAMGQVAEGASEYARHTKDTVAGEVKGVASALRTASDELRDGSPQERTLSQIAESLADASDAIQTKDLGEMVGAVTDFAKRNPVVFLGSALLVGFAATRFAKASGHGASGADGSDRNDKSKTQTSHSVPSRMSDAGTDTRVDQERSET